MSTFASVISVPETQSKVASTLCDTSDSSDSEYSSLSEVEIDDD